MKYTGPDTSTSADTNKTVHDEPACHEVPGRFSIIVDPHQSLEFDSLNVQPAHEAKTDAFVSTVHRTDYSPRKLHNMLANNMLAIQHHHHCPAVRHGVLHHKGTERARDDHDQLPQRHRCAAGHPGGTAAQPDDALYIEASSTRARATAQHNTLSVTDRVFGGDQVFNIQWVLLMFWPLVIPSLVACFLPLCQAPRFPSLSYHRGWMANLIVTCVLTVAGVVVAASVTVRHRHH